MIGYVEAPRAWSLTHGMARVLGVNLPRAVLDGWLSRKELATLVTRCQVCACDTKCVDFLARTVADDHLPDYCPNAAEIEALTPGN